MIPSKRLLNEKLPKGGLRINNNPTYGDLLEMLRLITLTSKDSGIQKVRIPDDAPINQRLVLEATFMRDYAKMIRGEL